MPACSHSKRWLRQREDPLRARNSPEVRNKLRMAKVSPRSWAKRGREGGDQPRLRFRVDDRR